MGANVVAFCEMASVFVAGKVNDFRPHPPSFHPSRFPSGRSIGQTLLPEICSNVCFSGSVVLRPVCGDHGRALVLARKSHTSETSVHRPNPTPTRPPTPPRSHESSSDLIRGRVGVEVGGGWQIECEKVGLGNGASCALLSSNRMPRLKWPSPTSSAPFPFSPRSLLRGA